MKTLAKEFGVLVVNNTGGTWSISPGSIQGEGWEQTIPGGELFVNRTYFDLAGLSIDFKTLFFEGAALQETLPPAATPSTVGNLAILVDVMSNKPLTNDEALIITQQGNTEGGSNLTFDQTIYMRHRVFNIDIDNAAGGYMIPISDNQLGSLEPTASDRVYCTRIVFFVGADGLYNLYPVRYLLRANAKEEAEYEYLMRLKRSYELQNEPDRD